MLLRETKVYGGRLKNCAELRASSSGGAFTALSDVFLSSGDGIVCSSYNFDTHQQEYKIIETVEERNAARGSKYFQSIPGDILRASKEWLSSKPGKNLLFLGMGCQAAGFKSYAEICGFRDRVTIVDIICHGVPSPRLWREYAESIEKAHGTIEALTFKDKRNGWMQPIAVATVNGMEVCLNRYVKIFYNCKGLRLSCHKCPYTTIERTTDITIGDFWHIEDKMPEQYNEMGTSLFIIHTYNGMELFERAKESIDWFESNIADCWQFNLEKPTPVAEDREKFWQDYNNKGIEYIINKYGKDSLTVKLKKKIKRIVKS